MIERVIFHLNPFLFKIFPKVNERVIYHLNPFFVQNLLKGGTQKEGENVKSAKGTMLT